LPTASQTLNVEISLKLRWSRSLCTTSLPHVAILGLRGCYARCVDVEPIRPGDGAGEEVAALRAELERTRAQLADAQHRALTLRDHAIGYEAELGQLRNHGGPRLESREMQAALFVVKVGKALRLNALLRFEPVKRMARYLLGVYRPA
jgi:hypothetical protein